MSIFSKLVAHNVESFRNYVGYYYWVLALKLGGGSVPT